MPNQNRILIVDDNPTNIDILEEMFEDRYQLAISSSGEEALSVAEDFSPDLVLLDVMMPGIDGYETCLKFRSHPTLQYTKIIMVSAKTLLTERMQGYEAGADDYVTKPFDRDELLAKVQVYLRLKSIEEMDRLKSGVLQWVCHETRTPLRGIIAPVEMLIDDNEMEYEERQHCLEMIHQSANRLYNLFEKVIILSELKAGKKSFAFEYGSLDNIVQSAIKSVEEDALECQVQIEYELLSESKLKIDKAKMKSAVVNLLQYAISLSPMDSQIIVQLSEMENTLFLTITDEGEGLDPEFMPYVFDEFTSSDMPLPTDGQGIALAISQQIVLGHRGTIQVESTKGEGTTFSILLPIT
jgi:signal transduction histidine kinase